MKGVDYMSGRKNGKKAEPPSELRTERLNQFMEWENLTQTALAKRIGTQQQNISRDKKLNKISEKRIDLIIEEFPEYRKEWFLGLDDFPTKKALRASQEKSRISLFVICWYAILCRA